jgi:hypothetical protein
MHEHQPSMDEIVCLLGKRISHYVMMLDRQLWILCCYRVNVLWVNVGRENSSRGSNSIGDPGRNRLATASNFQTAPASADATRVEALNRCGIIKAYGKDFVLGQP